MARDYFGGLYTRAKDGLSGARTKAGNRLGAIIFAMPRDHVWQIAHADMIEEILDWWEDGGNSSDRPQIAGRPCEAMFLDILDGAIDRPVSPVVPSLPALDLQAGWTAFSHYMSGRGGTPRDWKTEAMDRIP